MVNINEKPTKNQSRSVFVCNGASNHSNYDRAEYDYYATEPKAVELFLDAFEKDNALADSIDHNIWECACGENHIANVLRCRGYNVRTSDIVDRIGGNSGIEIIDFLESGGGGISGRHCHQSALQVRCGVC